LNTVAAIIGRWAPAQENNTQAYVDFVSKRLGVDPNQPLNMADPNVKAALADAIAAQEGGSPRQGGGARVVAQGAPKQKEAPSGYEWGADGTLHYIKGGPGDPTTKAKDAKVTEGERTAGFLSSRLADSLSNLSRIAETDARSGQPGIVESVAQKAGGEGAANLVRSADRQQVVANQLDILDAALTLGTGAAYTREQLENYRSTYFPGLTDKPSTVTAKRQKLIALLSAAQIKAGNAAPPELAQAIAEARAQFGTGASPAKAQTPASQLPAQARSQLKAGQVTTFGNGQRWTLRNGQPARVN
jgi:hypothetical protein